MPVYAEKTHRNICKMLLEVNARYRQLYIEEPVELRVHQVSSVDKKYVASDLEGT